MAKKKATSSDVAARAGVSQATVSMVLNRKYNVSFSRETVERVEQAARELGYEAAFTTSYGSAGPESGMFELPRFTPWDRDALRFSLRLGHNFFRGHSRRLLADEALV